MAKLDRSDSVFIKHFYRKSLVGARERSLIPEISTRLNPRIWKRWIRRFTNSPHLHIGWFGGVRIVSGGKR
jgi:hypothetical protein